MTRRSGGWVYCTVPGQTSRTTALGVEQGRGGVTSQVGRLGAQPGARRDEQDGARRRAGRGGLF